MKIFVSWSGGQARQIAEMLRGWLPQVLAGRVELFVSSQDISKGERPLNIISERLDDIDFGIVVVTAANQTASWINFEAGALGKHLGSGRVAPLLVDLSPADVAGPLTQFQMTMASDGEDVRKLVGDINAKLSSPVPEGSLRVLFAEAWEGFSSAVARARHDRPAPPAPRSLDEMVKEVLVRVRRIEVQQSESGAAFGFSTEDSLKREVAGYVAGPTSISVVVATDPAFLVIVLAEEASIGEGGIDAHELQRVADKYDAKIVIRTEETNFEVHPVSRTSPTAARDSR